MAVVAPTALPNCTSLRPHRCTHCRARRVLVTTCRSSKARGAGSRRKAGSKAPAAEARAAAPAPADKSIAESDVLVPPPADKTILVAPEDFQVRQAAGGWLAAWLLACRLLSWRPTDPPPARFTTQVPSGQLLPINVLRPPSAADVFKCTGCTKPACQVSSYSTLSHKARRTHQEAHNRGHWPGPSNSASFIRCLHVRGVLPDPHACA